MSKSKLKLVIVDSGICKNHTVFCNDNFPGIFIRKGSKEGELELLDNIEDTIGHGTAITYILNNVKEYVDIYVVKLFDNEMDITCNTYITALQFINSNLNPDILHLSNGVSMCDNIEELRKACDSLVNNGTIIIAAFDNSGCISYPAAFPNVIGVDMTLNCKKVTDFEFVKNSIINIRGAAITQTLPWKDGGYQLVSGSSFIAPYITILIVDLLMKGFNNLDSILQELLKKAKTVHEGKKYKKIEKCFDINKAIVFPFNKEIHSIVRYSELLSFELKEVYDSKYFNNINRRASELLTEEIKKDYIIKNIDTINWEDDFDTIILGHTREISKLTGKDYKKYIIEKSIINNKNIYAFDDLKDYPILLNKMKKKKLKVYTPKILESNVPGNRFGKLYRIAKPTLGIFGTTSKQGKFTLQLELRKKFLENGFLVGQMGTEPSSLLFGMDKIYPMGYDSTVEIKDYDAVTVINELIHEIEIKNPDIIIVGSQSQTVAYELDNLRYIPLSQFCFISGCDLDGYILVVNYYDEIEYITRTVNYLDNITAQSHVIAIVLFPFDNNLQWSVLGNKRYKVDKNQIEKKRKEIVNNTNKNVFILGVKNELDRLFETCINYYSS